MLDASSDVPSEYCPVYVAPEQRWFVIPMSYFNLLVFRLLEKAEELPGRSSARNTTEEVESLSSVAGLGLTRKSYSDTID
ncbi:hypothetical protein GW17_00058097 [Ensete ventricosum]|nr:hypothetical protein GW17_00058097 [Ensete ventricosum]